MDTPLILPFQHPTTVLFVDDSKLFVRSVGLRVASELEVEVVEDARIALERINRSPDIASLFPRSDYGASSIRRMELDPARVQEQFRSLTRFRRVSVVVADYGMPAMSGLDLCSRIVDEAIQKVLITGLADHREVIQAFGERSIQGFIPKERPTLFSELVHDVRELRRQYFVEKARYLKTHLGMESAPFALDPVVSDYFSKICGRLEIAEHYIVQEPPGILMVSSRGLVHRLVVLDESQLHDQISVVRACGAPLEVEQAIRSKAKAVALDYSLLKQRAESHPWESLLIDLERLVGCQSWYVGLASDTRATDLQYVASYLSYVEELDGRY